MKTAEIRLETLTCPACIQKIEGAMKSIQGIDVNSISVSFNTSKAKAQFDEAQTNIETIREAITSLGYEVKSAKVK